MDKLKTAVIGYGKVAHTHAEALASIPESEFVAVCGRDGAKARSFADLGVTTLSPWDPRDDASPS